MVEYGKDMRRIRIDPADPNERPAMLERIERILKAQRFSRRAELLREGRTLAAHSDKEIPVT